MQPGFPSPHWFEIINHCQVLDVETTYLREMYTNSYKLCIRHLKSIENSLNMWLNEQIKRISGYLRYCKLIKDWLWLIVKPLSNVSDNRETLTGTIYDTRSFLVLIT